MSEIPEKISQLADELQRNEKQWDRTQAVTIVMARILDDELDKIRKQNRMTVRQKYKAAALASGRWPANLHIGYPGDDRKIANECSAMASAMMVEDVEYGR